MRSGGVNDRVPKAVLGTSSSLERRRAWNSSG